MGSVTCARPHVDVRASEAGEVGDFGEGEIVGGESADGSEVHEFPDDGFGGDAAVAGVGATEKLIDQEENRGVAGGLGGRGPLRRTVFQLPILPLRRYINSGAKNE